MLTILRIHALTIYLSTYMYLRLLQPVVVGRCCRCGATERFDYVACPLLAVYCRDFGRLPRHLASFPRSCWIPSLCALKLQLELRSRFHFKLQHRFQFHFQFHFQFQFQFRLRFQLQHGPVADSWT